MNFQVIQVGTQAFHLLGRSHLYFPSLTTKGKGKYLLYHNLLTFILLPNWYLVLILV